MKLTSKNFTDKMLDRIQSVWFLAVLARFLPLMLLNPDVLDLVQSFIPRQYVPKFLMDYIEAGANWTVTTVWAIAALLISTYLVHRQAQKQFTTTNTELKNKLAAYEDHEPEYNILVSKVEVSRKCSCHTNIAGLINITPQNAWEGVLSNKPFITCGDKLVTDAFISKDFEFSVNKFRDEQYSPRVEFPYPIPINGTTILLFDLKFPLGDEDINSPILSSTVSFCIELVYTYYAPALGHPVENKQTVKFGVDLLNLEKYQRR